MADYRHLLAFYLPQFHPIPENDAWWGAGFTEWHNVARARPQFPGHYQPHVPGELGYYDLRLAEVREAQAALAREHGITGFCYYHYWFHGKRLLERPFNEVLTSGQPDFPFCLCWANEPWTRNWDARTGVALQGQEHSDEDDRAHIEWLIQAFRDERYIKIDGRPLFLVYRAMLLPSARRTAATWRDAVAAAGFPGLYLAKVESHGDRVEPYTYGFDAGVGFLPEGADVVQGSAEGYRSNTILDYPSAVKASLASLADRRWPYRRFPAVVTGWDNTARRPAGGAFIYTNTSPEAYERWLQGTIESLADVPAEERLAFVVAWNEWAEGNHLEPDRRDGRAYLEATARAVGLRAVKRDADRADDEYSYVYRYRSDSNLGNVVGLVRDFVPHGGTIVDLGAGAGVIAEPLLAAGYGYFGVDEHPLAVERMRRAGLPCAQCDVDDLSSVGAAVARVADPACVLLLDVIEHLERPDRLLSLLSIWALRLGGVPLAVSVPNVTHRDIAFRLLFGRFSLTRTGLLDSTHLRFFDEETLERLFENCGWRRVARDDYHVERSDQYDERLASALPSSVTSLLRLASTVGAGTSTVQQYIWLLEPVAVDRTPESYLDAIAGDSQRPDFSLTPGMAQVLSSHLWAISGVPQGDYARLHDEYENVHSQFRALEGAYRALEAHCFKVEAEYRAVVAQRDELSGATPSANASQEGDSDRDVDPRTP